MSSGAAIGFWRTVWLLLKTSRRRADGRQLRQRQLLNNRSGRNATDWGAFAVFVGILVMAGLHGVAAFTVLSAVDAAQVAEVERQGKLVVSEYFIDEVRASLEEDPSGATGESLEGYYSEEAHEIVEHRGGDEAVTEQRLRAAVAASGARNLVSREDTEAGLSSLATAGPVGAILGSFLLLWWFAMLVCQGEGLELDLQRRRHPMWEWLLSHPIGAGAVFFAEMVSPLTANPTYWTAPIFAGILYGASQDFLTGVVAAVLIGVPVAVTAACIGKALEIGAILRLPVRSRGAVIGILSWFGYAALISFILFMRLMPHIAAALGGWLGSETAFSSPVLRLFLGMNGAGEASLLRGALFCWGVCAILVTAAVVFSARSARKGLSGAFASDQLASRPGKRANFGRRPLFRKEYLWFVRDRSAIVQTILIPVTVAGFQLFNLRGIVSLAGETWYFLSGIAIFFGTYFLWVLGSKSLTSEGAALWIALTWPRGLESVLKAKAWLWSTIASGLVVTVLLVSCWFFPHDWWKIVLVAIGWFFFSRSMAEKSVTLVTIVSESGEAEKIPAGRRWATQLGMLTFAIGVCTQQWNLAVVGIVYSWITSAAMWENFRARLPYLYDPWSEEIPRPPTLMHAMVSISILIECASIITGLVFAIGGKDSLAVAQGFGYAVCAVGVSIGVTNFLSQRGVSPAQIWCRRDVDPETEDEDEAPEPWIRRYLAADRGEARWLLYAVGAGVLLAGFAHIYLRAIGTIPSIAQQIHASQQAMRSIPGMTAAYAVMAIGFAPFAEEYLFRGLVFRALDRHWGGWKAVAGAALFFGIYHPWLAWVPVTLVGAANCLLFKKSKRLAPAVLLHMSYNAVVTLWM